MMHPIDERNAWFEQDLRNGLSDKGVAYQSVEAGVFRRIRECEEQGILGLLCIDEIPDAKSMDYIEHELFSQISQYNEYDEPVNECLRGDVELSEKQWDRIAERIDERLAPVLGRPLWEQQLFASMEEPTLGHWEAFETALFNRIGKTDAQYKERWESYETSDTPVMSQSLEKAEELLDCHIAIVATRPVWEHVLATEKILPMSMWEGIEQRFFASIEVPDPLELNKQPFWNILEQYVVLFKRGAVAACAIIALAAAGIGILKYREDFTVMPTVVYQLNDAKTGQVDIVSTVNHHLRTASGEGVTVMNTHGSIELHDQSALTINKLNKREARYSVAFSEDQKSNEGDVTFFVRRQPQRNCFSVVTPEYTVEVKGTYFKIGADHYGKVSTTVLEGMVKIKDGPLGDTLLKAGQSLAYHPGKNGYVIIDGGATVARDELELMPGVQDILSYAVVHIVSSEARSTIRLNGKRYFGRQVSTRLPPGEYRAIINKDGFVTVDTSFVVAADLSMYRFDVDLVQSAIDADLKRVTKESEPLQFGESTITTNDTTSARSPRSAVLYAAAQKAELESNWKKAVALYTLVFNDPNTTTLRREDALFSMGKIQADHLRENESAKKSFLTYVALFPGGSFAGETWLRLAELEFRKNQDNAIHYYVKFFEQFPRHPRVAELQDRVGMIYLQKKQPEKAITMFDLALAHHGLSETETRDIATHLYRALLEYGETARARTVKTRYYLTSK